MPTWGQILGELRQLVQQGNLQAFDTVRNKYLKALSDYTGRNSVIYATRWTSGDVPPNLISITDEDIHAFMEAIAGLQGENLDLILHTGGGSGQKLQMQLLSDLRLKI